MKNAQPSQRQLRVAELVRHALAVFFQRGEIQDPRLEGHVISISEVTMTPDLKLASCYISILGVDNAKATEIAKALNTHARFIRGRLSPALREMKFIPSFRFHIDTSFANFQKIDSLLRSAAVSRDLQNDNLKKSPTEKDQD